MLESLSFLWSGGRSYPCRDNPIFIVIHAETIINVAEIDDDKKIFEHF